MLIRKIYLLISCIILSSNIYAQLNTWTWIHGDSVIGTSGVCGAKGVFNPINYPSWRINATEWTDSNGDFWLFGGVGSAASGGGNGYLNDLWKYNVSTNQWAWISGDTAINKGGVYGSLGVPNTTNRPGCRYGSVSWIDNYGNLWLYGGLGFSIFSNSGFFE